jgi:predicted nucleic acid-binding protein
MRRAVLDSNAVDPFIDLTGAQDVVRVAVRSGQLELLFTHVNIDELAATPDADRRSRLLLALVDFGHLVPTGAFDFSRLGYARLMDDADVVEALRSRNVDHTRDALIASTAVFEKCALVTNEKRLTARARDRGIEVLSSLDLLHELGFTSNP